MRIEPFLIFAFCLGILLPFNSEAQDSLFLKESIQKWRNATAYTLELVKSMPFENYDFKPVEDERSFSEQLEHIGENMTWLAGTYLGGRKFEHPLLERKAHTPEETVEKIRSKLGANLKQACNTSHLSPPPVLGWLNAL